LDFKKRDPNEDQSEAILHLKIIGVRNFELYPYYGYTGWDGDVIQLLEGHNDSSDSLLNALARTYRVSADNLINPNNIGFAAPRVTYNLAMTQN
jgi:hypothetical protein